MKKLFILFYKMLYVSSFTFGGGFVIVSFMRKIFAEQLGWISEDEMLDYTAIAQSSPGAIAVNAAVAIGFHVAGLSGIVFAVLGTVIPPLVVISLLSFFYTAFAANTVIAVFIAGMRCCVVAVIADAALSLIDFKSVGYLILMTAAFVLYFFFHTDIVIIILSAIIIGVIRSVCNAF